MLSLFSTLGGLLISGLPKLLDFFQNKADQKHELALARVQVEMQLQMMAQGFAAQERMEEIRTDQIAMETWYCWISCLGCGKNSGKYGCSSITFCASAGFSIIRFWIRYSAVTTWFITRFLICGGFASNARFCIDFT